MARKELKVEKREVLGKKVAQLRRRGVLPGNVFGHGVDSVAVQFDSEVFEKTLKTAVANEVFDLTIEGERQARPVVVQKVQRHPLTSGILHADFYQVSLREKMRGEVPIVLTGRSEGVDTYNGVLMTPLESLHVEALPLDMPASIEVDISPLAKLEDSIFLRDINLPPNITVLNDPDVVLVKVASPRISAEEAAEEEEAAAEAAAPAEAGAPAAEEAAAESAES